jgi:hypothetical protein
MTRTFHFSYYLLFFFHPFIFFLFFIFSGLFYFPLRIFFLFSFLFLIFIFPFLSVSRSFLIPLSFSNLIHPPSFPFPATSHVPDFVSILQTAEEWQTVFWINAIVMCIGTGTFCSLLEAKRQAWDIQEDLNNDEDGKSSKNIEAFEPN